MSFYDYIVIDTDSPLEDAVAMISNNFPDLILMPINKSQKRSLQDLPNFLDTVASVETRANREPGVSYYPKFIIVPLGMNEKNVRSKLNEAKTKPKNCQVALAMDDLQDEIDEALEQNKFIWDFEKKEKYDEYFKQLLNLGDIGM